MGYTTYHDSYSANTNNEVEQDAPVKEITVGLKDFLTKLVQSHNKVNQIADELSKAKYELVSIQKIISDLIRLNNIEDANLIVKNNFKLLLNVDNETFLITFDEESLKPISVESICWIV